MSAKHTVHTDALDTLGTIIDETAKRDAIHLAVEPCIAGEQLYAGQHIGLFNGRALLNAVTKLGIVDPFVKGPIPEGSRFWMVVYPRTITSLRHVWEHPDFQEVEKEKEDKISEATRAASEAWLRNFCQNADCPGYDIVMSTIMGSPPPAGEDDEYYHCEIDEEYLHFGGRDAHGEIPSEFWGHVEIVTGRKQFMRPNHFSCSC